MILVDANLPIDFKRFAGLRHANPIGDHLVRG